MYNLTVDQAHTFFVGQGRWLVHNDCFPTLKITDEQFGQKLGQHARDFGLDPSNPAHRDQFRNMLTDITTNFDDVPRQGSWRGGGGDHFFFKQGDVVVVTKQDGEFVTILDKGIDNSWFKDAKPIQLDPTHQP